MGIPAIRVAVHERSLGAATGRPRVKVVRLGELLHLAGAAAGEAAGVR